MHAEETARETSSIFSSAIYIISKLLVVHADKSALSQQPGEERYRFLAVSSPVIMRRSGIGSPDELRNARRETAARRASMLSSGYMYII
jgi:hypothetical protein